MEMLTLVLKNIVIFIRSLFGAMGPLYILFFLAMSMYAVFYQFAYRFLFLNDSEHALGLTSDAIARRHSIGIAILVLLGFFKLNWVGSWIMALVITFFCDKQYQSPSKGQVIMQAGTRFETGMTARWVPDGRPRIGPVCDQPSADRTFHDHATKRCLPLYDHYCFWIHVCVYSRTMKPYLYFILFLLFDILATIGITIWALTISSLHQMHLTPFFGSLLSASAILAIGIFDGGLLQWWHLAIKNEVIFEYRAKPRKPVLLCMKDSRGANHIARIQVFHGNPWDLGWKQNLKQVLGSSIWMWAFFWVQPERVDKYGHYHGTDLPFGPSVWALRQQLIARPLNSTQFGLALLREPVARSRRHEYSHSSLEDAAEPRRRRNRTSELPAPQ